jgi:hypothetical protein
MCAKAVAKGEDYEFVLSAKEPCQEAPRAAAGADQPDPNVLRVELVKFLLSDEKMGQRISADALAPYAKKLFRAAETFAKAESSSPTAVTITVAIKPGGERRIWAAAEKGAKLPPARLRALEAELRKVGTIDPRELIAFQVLVQLWGGAPKDASAYPSVPDAWNPVLQREGRLEAEALILKVWE